MTASLGTVLFVAELYPGGWVPTSRMRMVELERLGHRVTPVDTCPYMRWGGKWMGFPFRRLEWGPPLWRLNAEIQREAVRVRPDMLWVDKGIWVSADTLRRLRTSGVRRLVHYTPDPAFVGNRSRHFIEAIPEYDLVVTTKRYELDDYQRSGAKNLLFQYPSFDRDVHKPETPTPEEAKRFSSDLVFVGSYAPGREKFLRPLAEAGFDLAIWGNQWEGCRDPIVRRHLRGAGIGGRDYALALSCAKIGLGLLSPLWPDRSTTRSLEIPACGTFLLAPRTEEHAELFVEGVEAEYFDSEKELVEKSRLFLARPDVRARIAAAGHQKCLSAGYSSRDRVREILARATGAAGPKRDHVFDVTLHSEPPG